MKKYWLHYILKYIEINMRILKITLILYFKNWNYGIMGLTLVILKVFIRKYKKTLKLRHNDVIMK